MEGDSIVKEGARGKVSARGKKRDNEKKTQCVSLCSMVTCPIGYVMVQFLKALLFCFSMLLLLVFIETFSVNCFIAAFHTTESLSHLKSLL